MIIKSIHVRNFCSILDETLPCEQLTALVGPNGSGKSSFLRALELFYASSIKLGPEDFYAEDTSNDIEIIVTFTDLDTEETERFKGYIENGDLTVVRVLSSRDGKTSTKYHGSALQNPDFAIVRGAGVAREITVKYNELRRDPRYTDFPTVRSKDAALEALKEWEVNNPGQCTRQRDEGQFFGFTEVAQGYLGKYTRFILIPAVRDAAEDAAEGKGSPITEIMDLVVRSVLAERQDVTQLKEDAQKRYEEIMDPGRLAELGVLEKQLTDTLRTYVPDAGVSLLWSTVGSIEIPMPRADVKLVENDYRAPISRSGHGLQRAFILTMLQHLAIAHSSVEQRFTGEEDNQDTTSDEAPRETKLPNLILGIEEPELYQHPNRQRHLAKILLQLATGSIAGVAQKTQVIYSTHSPLFVGIDRIDQIRLLRKIAQDDDKPKIAKVVWTSLDCVADDLRKVSSKPEQEFTSQTLLPRLQAIMTPWMNEGFFADVVVLVEGENDRAAILGTAFSMGYDLESKGISVIPCMGKNNLDRPLMIFRQLKIPTYVIWDSDKENPDAKPDNRYLLLLVGQPEEDWPDIVHNNFACFEFNLEARLREEIGPEVFAPLFKDAQSRFGMSKEQALKNSAVIKEVIINAATTQDKHSKTMESIIQKILTLLEASIPSAAGV
jgi:putative ATP-dependent endonuclease of the OLD family